MQYNPDMDNQIIELLWDRQVGYNELKRMMEKKLGKKLSYDTFDRHVDKLLESKSISRIGDTGKRGYSVLYSVTADLKKKKQLQILGYDRKQVILRKTYECILLFEFSRWPIMLKFNQIRSFLSELDIKLEDLKVKSIRHLPSEEEFHKYPDAIFVWTQTHYEPVKVAGEMEIEVWKNESVKPSPTDGFGVRLPGFSKSEVLNKARFGDLKPTDAELEEAFNMLLREHILKPTSFMFRKEMRYVIADEDLRIMIKDLYDIHFPTEWLMLLNKWEYLEPPTEEESKWLVWLWGEKEASVFFNRAELQRYELRKKKDMVITFNRNWVNRLRKEADHKFKKFKASHEQTLRRYSYFSDIIGGISPMVRKYLQSP